MTYNIHWTYRVFFRQCPFPHLVQIKINNASFAFLHLLGNEDQESELFKERQGFYHFPFPAGMHHHLSLLFTIIIAIWPTNQCLVSSLEEAGACRQSYITISSSYHSLPPVTDTGRNWEEGKYRISSQSTFLQAKYMTFLKMNKKTISKNWQREHREYFIFFLEDIQGIV